jgi:hypothetical protein
LQDTSPPDHTREQSMDRGAESRCNGSVRFQILETFGRRSAHHRVRVGSLTSNLARIAGLISVILSRCPLFRCNQSTIQTREEPYLLLDTILCELKAERDRLDRAIAALQGTTAVTSKPTSAPSKTVRRHRRKMSADARERISEAKKAWWAKKKRKKGAGG